MLQGQAGLEFQSTLSAWGATEQDVWNFLKEGISIHAPPMGSDIEGGSFYA